MFERSNEYYLSLFKSRIISRICANPVAVKLINPTPNDKLDIEDVLLGGDWEIDHQVVHEQGHVFDYNFMTDTTKDTKTFICVEALPTYSDYPTIDVLLYIHIYVHKDLMRLTSDKALLPSIPTKNEMNQLGYIGNRCDQLTQVIGEMFNGVDDIGGLGGFQPYERGYITLDLPNYEFYGKCMIYKVKISNVENLACEN